MKKAYLNKDSRDKDGIGEEHSVHGQREGQPLDGVLQKRPQRPVSQDVHDSEVASQQLVDVIWSQEP